MNLLTYQPERYSYIWLSLCLFVFVPIAVHAFVVEVFVEEVVYEPQVLTGPIDSERTIYGALEDYPHLYEITLTATSSFSITIQAVDETDQAPRFSGIVVREEADRGVVEVSRLLASDASWELWRDSLTRMEYRQGPRFETELGPGTYRFEVSTPDNQGRYALRLGDTAVSVGYFELVRNIRVAQQFHGANIFALFHTAPVAIPLLIILTVFGMYATWRFARRRGLV